MKIYASIKLRQHKIRFSLTVEHILALTSSSNMVREMKKSASKFYANCLTMFYVIECSRLDS